MCQLAGPRMGGPWPIVDALYKYLAQATCFPSDYLEPNPHRPAGTPHAMRTRAFFDDRIDTLDRNAVGASPARQIFRTVSTIIALIRVSILALLPPADSHWWINKDKMIHDEDCVQFSEYCFNICTALEPAIQGKNADDLDESLRMALEDLARCVNQPWPCLLTVLTNYRLILEIERALRRRASTPHSKYNKREVEGHKLKIREILNGPSLQSSLDEKPQCG